MGGHVHAEIVRISDKDAPAHRNTDTFNVLFLWVGIGLSVGVGVGVGGKLPMSVAPLVLLTPKPVPLVQSTSHIRTPVENTLFV